MRNYGPQFIFPGRLPRDNVLRLWTDEVVLGLRLALPVWPWTNKND